MKNELCITFEKMVVVVKYHFPIERERSLLDAIKLAWEKKTEQPLGMVKPQSVRPSVREVEIYGVKTKRGMIALSGFLWNQIQRSLNDVPSKEYTEEEVYQSHVDFLIGF